MPLGVVAAQRSSSDAPVGPGLSSFDAAALAQAAHLGPDGRTAVRAAVLQAQVLDRAGLGYIAPPLMPAAQGTSADATGFAQSSGSVGLLPIGGLVGAGTVAVGDLDGDGGDDVVTLSFEGSGITITALRGTDGSTIWLAPQPAGVVGGFLQAIEDVDGDGRRDLVDAAIEVLDSSGSGECDNTGCRDEYVETFRTTTTVIDGGSGSVLWTESVDGSVRQIFASSNDGSSYSIGLEQSNVGVPYYPMGDIDTDGGTDLISALTTTTMSESYSQEGTAPGPVTTRESRSSSGSGELRLIAGVDGSLIRASTDAADGYVSVALPVPDVDGDGVNDVLATRQRDGTYVRECMILLVELSCEESGSSAEGGVAVVGGADLATVWAIDGLEPLVIAQAPADLAGDNAVDVIVSQFSLDGSATPPRLLALDDASGAELWRIAPNPPDEDNPFSGLQTLAPLGATPLQEDDGIDLLAIESIIDFDPDSGRLDVSVAILRLDGASGETLLRTEPDFGATDGESVLGIGGQVVSADADDRADVLVQAVAIDDSEGTQRTIAIVEDGPEGTIRSERVTPGFSALRVLGDVDGDGMDEATSDQILFGFITTSGTASSSAVGGPIAADSGSARTQRDGASSGGASGSGEATESESVVSVVELATDAVVWAVPGPATGSGSSGRPVCWTPTTRGSTSSSTRCRSWATRCSPASPHDHAMMAHCCGHALRP